jgi:ribosomal protein S27AE
MPAIWIRKTKGVKMSAPKCPNCGNDLIIKPTSDNKIIVWCERCNLVTFQKTLDKAILRFNELMKRRMESK